MSDDDKGLGGTGLPPVEPPEFVAVRPRGVEPSPPADHEPESEAPSPPQSEPQPESERGSEPESEPAPGGTPDPQPVVDSAPAAAEAPERTALAVSEPAEPTGPEPLDADDMEVSVRVAAEGMAAAWAGHPTPPDAARAVDERALSPMALATAICVVLAIAAGALLAVTAHSVSHHKAVTAARAAAYAAGKTDVALLLTYSYKTFDQDIARAEVGMSPSFRASYLHTMTTEVGPLAQQIHAVTNATVVAAGVESGATPTRVKLLVIADQVVQNVKLNATSRLDESTNEVTMVKQGGRWVIDDVTTF